MGVARPRLIVLAPSHFCERARWALDHAGIGYGEIRWAPGLHVPLARRIARHSFLPIFDTGNAVVQGSDRILDWIGTPGGDKTIERRFEAVVGPLVRQYLYAATLGNSESGIRTALFHGLSVPHRWAAHLLWPATRRLMIAGINARAELLPSLETRLAAELDWLDRHVAGRAHLAGDSLGRADITAASLLAPLLRGPAVNPLYDRVRLPDCIEATLAQWAHRPSLAWVRGLYAHHRGRANIS
jgi:glutathione S-transferase